MMELILSKRSQKERKLKKQQTELSRLSKLLPDDLYKTITRKSRCYREERTNKRPQYQHRSIENGLKCTLSTSTSSSSLGSIASISVSSQSTGEMSDESLSIDSDDEIPIWVHGEQRWISGITNETTCAQLVEALLRNEGINGEPASVGATTTDENQYAITERWRRVEQMLDNKTKILKIWRAWGQTKSEVRLTLRRIDSQCARSRSHHVDYDSGRESPISRADSAIVRRRRHRSAKIWSKHAKTIHPKSSKASIEQLMKLILEQGETIHKQLSKLRDREHEIAEYEDDHHHTHRRHAENKMGKNYLLETYLNGLHEVGAEVGGNGNGGDGNDASGGEKSANNANGIDDGIDKAIITTPGNSDSGVNTSNTEATSPEVCLSSPLTNGSSSSSTDNNNDRKSTGVAKAKIMDTKSLKDICKRLTTKKGKKEKKQSAMKLAEGATSREAKLIAEHESRREFCEKMEKTNEDNAKSAGVNAAATIDAAESIADNARKPLNVNEHLAGQIELLEKVIAINKHIQREEELLVRLNAKIRKYEVDDPNLTEADMRKVLDQINSNIENSNSELVQTEHELNESNQMLIAKSQIVKELSKELEALEIDGCTNQNLIQVPSHQIQIHSSNTEEHQEMQQNTAQQEQQQQQQQILQQQQQQQQQQAPEPSTHPPNETNQMPTVIPSNSNSMRTGTLPKLISSVLKRNTPINAKNTYSGTIPKSQQRTMCNQMQAQSSNVVERTMAPVPMPSNAVFVAKNQSFLVPDHVILSQAPLFFQKDTFNGNFMQSTDQRNINTINTSNNNNYSNRTISNLTSSNSINLNNVNINPSMGNCGKVGPKKLINGFYKDPDSDTGLSSLGEDGLLHVGTLV